MRFFTTMTSSAFALLGPDDGLASFSATNRATSASAASTSMLVSAEASKCTSSSARASPSPRPQRRGQESPPPWAQREHQTGLHGGGFGRLRLRGHVRIVRINGGGDWRLHLNG
eukprot:2833321-Pleurochrysis_carterae.AAC.1